MEDSEHNDGFKVSDRRRFTVEGETKDEQSEASSAAEEVSPKSEEEPAAAKEEPQAPDGEPESTARKEEPPPPLDFSGLVLSLANTALFQLGMIKISESEEPKKDLSGARQTIDLLSLLEEKTQGNLTDTEKKLLSETLFQLRMAFVEASK